MWRGTPPRRRYITTTMTVETTPVVLTNVKRHAEIGAGDNGQKAGAVTGERETREHAGKTLFDIEREKRWRIWLLFGLLLAMAFAAAWVAV